MPITKIRDTLIIHDLVTMSDIKQIKQTHSEKVFLMNIHFSNQTESQQFFKVLINNSRIRQIKLENISDELITILEQSLPERTQELYISAGDDQNNYFDYKTSKIICGYNQWIYERKNCSKENSNGNADRLLTFRFKNKIIFQIKITNSLPEAIIIGKRINPSTSIPKNLPYARLLQQLVPLRNHQDYKELIPRVFNNYFNGPLVDYLDFRLNHGLIMGNSEDELSPIYDDLFSALDKEGIHHSIIKDDNFWARDFIFCAGNGIQHIQGMSSLTDEDHLQVSQLAKNDPNSYISKKWLNQSKTLAIGGSAISKITKAERKLLPNYCVGNQIDFINLEVLLEGGNVITLEKDNKIYALIGQDILLANAYWRTKKNYSDPKKIEELQLKFSSQNKFKSRHPFYKNLDNQQKIIIRKNYKENTIETELLCTGHIKEAKAALANAINLPKDQIIWIPNPDFHIDLFLTPGPNGILFLNNFLLVAQLAYKEFQTSKARLDKNICESALYFDSMIGDILIHIKTLLTNKGFKVIDVPGVIYIRDSLPKPNCNSYRIIANFMNAFTGFGKNGHYYITLPGPIKTINDELIKILKDNKVDNVYFVGSPILGEELLKKSGALRCKSVPGSFYGNLGSSKGFASEIYLVDPSPRDNYTFFSKKRIPTNQSTFDNETAKINGRKRSKN